MEQRDLPDYHVVFSTSCSDQQNWESYVFFYHARRVRQRGSVSRIASGCTSREAEALRDMHLRHIAPLEIHDERLEQSFRLHLTPDYSRVRLSGGTLPYKYMNKPYGLRHWMEHELRLGWTADNTTITTPFLEHDSSNAKHQQQQSAKHQQILDGIVILMDPDMILLRPIGHDFSNAEEVWVDGEKPAITKVTHGHPIAQQDGYLNNEWMTLNSSYITQDPTITRPAWSDGPKHWNTGPPYLATVSDMYKIVSLWTETAPRTLDVYPKLFAEMYGFIWATVMLKLPFALTQSIVVSTTESTDREGWALVDAIDDADICRVPVTATSYVVDGGGDHPPPQLPTLPVGLHYCKRYMLGKVSVVVMLSLVWEKGFAVDLCYTSLKLLTHPCTPYCMFVYCTPTFLLLFNYAPAGQNQWFFSKYRLKKNIMNCDKNLLKPPPLDFYSPDFTYTIAPPRADLKDKDTYQEERHTIPVKQAKREAFMLCGMISSVNEALLHYKRRACDPASVNLNQVYTVHDDPTNH